METGGLLHHLALVKHATATSFGTGKAHLQWSNTPSAMVKRTICNGKTHHLQW